MPTRAEDVPGYNKQYYEDHQEARRVAVRRNQREKQAKVRTLKLERGCDVCGYRRSARALQFHHHNKDKEGNVARLTNSGSWERIVAEIEKCMLLCANCHAEKHDNNLAL